MQSNAYTILPSEPSKQSDIKQQPNQMNIRIIDESADAEFYRFFIKSSSRSEQVSGPTSVSYSDETSQLEKSEKLYTHYSERLESKLSDREKDTAGYTKYMGIDEIKVLPGANAIISILKDMKDSQDVYVAYVHSIEMAKKLGDNVNKFASRLFVIAKDIQTERAAKNHKLKVIGTLNHIHIDTNELANDYRKYLRAQTRAVTTSLYFPKTKLPKELITIIDSYAKPELSEFDHEKNSHDRALLLNTFNIELGKLKNTCSTIIVMMNLQSERSLGIGWQTIESAVEDFSLKTAGLNQKLFDLRTHTQKYKVRQNEFRAHVLLSLYQSRPNTMPTACFLNDFMSNLMKCIEVVITKKHKGRHDDFYKTELGNIAKKIHNDLIFAVHELHSYQSSALKGLGKIYNGLKRLENISCSENNIDMNNPLVILFNQYKEKIGAFIKNHKIDINDFEELEMIDPGFTRARIMGQIGYLRKKT